ncbi:unnamed protein product [Arabidopsis halleri]
MCFFFNIKILFITNRTSHDSKSSSFTKILLVEREGALDAHIKSNFLLRLT